MAKPKTAPRFEEYATGPRPGPDDRGHGWQAPAAPPMTPPPEEACPPVAPTPREPAPPASAQRIPLSSARFGPDVVADRLTIELIDSSWPGREDLALDVALGCVTWGVYLVPLANVRAMVRAGSGA